MPPRRDHGPGVMVRPGAMSRGYMENPTMEDQAEIKIMVPSTILVLDCGMIWMVLVTNLSSANMIQVRNKFGGGE